MNSISLDNNLLELIKENPGLTKLGLVERLSLSTPNQKERASMPFVGKALDKALDRLLDSSLVIKTTCSSISKMGQYVYFPQTGIVCHAPSIPEHTGRINTQPSLMEFQSENQEDVGVVTPLIQANKNLHNMMKQLNLYETAPTPVKEIPNLAPVANIKAESNGNGNGAKSNQVSPESPEVISTSNKANTLDKPPSLSDSAALGLPVLYFSELDIRFLHVLAFLQKVEASGLLALQITVAQTLKPKELVGSISTVYRGLAELRDKNIIYIEPKGKSRLIYLHNSFKNDPDILKTLSYLSPYRANSLEVSLEVYKNAINQYLSNKDDEPKAKKTQSKDSVEFSAETPLLYLEAPVVEHEPILTSVSVPATTTVLPQPKYLEASNWSEVIVINTEHSESEVEVLSSWKYDLVNKALATLNFSIKGEQSLEIYTQVDKLIKEKIAEKAIFYYYNIHKYPQLTILVD
jgi:hypothetical protein